MTKARLCLGILGLFAVLAAGCGRKTDPRFENAMATWKTVQSAYGVATISQDDIAKHMQGGGKFTLHNENDFREAFTDYRSPADEGSAGFVFGRLVRSKDNLVFETKGDRTNIFVEGAPRTQPAAVLIQNKDDRSWKFSIKDSVPSEIRTRLLDLYRRAEEAKRNAGK